MGKGQEVGAVKMETLGSERGLALGSGSKPSDRHTAFPHFLTNHVNQKAPVGILG